MVLPRVFHHFGREGVVSSRQGRKFFASVGRGQVGGSFLCLRAGEDCQLEAGNHLERPAI